VREAEYEDIKFGFTFFGQYLSLSDGIANTTKEYFACMLNIDRRKGISTTINF
jgi:hypothetical protein